MNIYRCYTYEILWELSNNEPQISSEVRLWIMVIAQAFKDASIRSVRKRKNKVAKREAIKWLLYNEEDFRLVCWLADKCHYKIRKRAQRKFDFLN